jgi:hypothetical protein
VTASAGASSLLMLDFAAGPVVTILVAACSRGAVDRRQRHDVVKRGAAPFSSSCLPSGYRLDNLSAAHPNGRLRQAAFAVLAAIVTHVRRLPRDVNY